MTTTKINPVFADLSNPTTIKNGVKTMIKRGISIPIPHTGILEKLIEQFKILDFEVLAYPKVKKLRASLKELDPESERAKEVRKELDKIKLNTKHYLVLAIENILNVAKKNRWGICKNHDFIYLFNGAFWSNIDKETFQKFLGEASEKMGVNKFSARHFRFREDLFKQFIATAYLPTPDNDNDTVLINLENGTFEIGLNGTKLRAFNNVDFLTYQLPFKYTPKAKAPIFKAYLDRVLPDQQRQKVLAEFLGFVFMKHGNKRLKEEKALILYGGGANGKSVFFEIVNALLGSENTSSYSLQDLTQQNGYFRAMIANKLVNYGSEISGKLEADVFKKMVSGEPLSARLPYGKPMQLKQYAKLIFNCNELPKDVEHTNAYFRRFLIIPFDVTIPDEEQDKQLHTKIIDNELSGVFNWVLDGLNRLLKQKRFTNCDAAMQAIEQYKTQSDSVKMFIDENAYKSSPDNYKLIKELYFDYKMFCNEDGFMPVNKTNFKKRLEGAGIFTNRITCGNVAYLSK